MKGNIRETGIDIVGDASWGTHFCQFYKTKKDLVEILIPYFKTGLENNEFCMWITSEPLKVEDAKTELNREVRDFDRYVHKGQIEILDCSEWYTKSGKFEANKVLKGWVEKEKDAIKKGFDGLRLAGNTFWLEKRNWRDFAEYEEKINSVIGKFRMIAICSYALDKCGAADIIDVVSNHGFALVKRTGKWETIENSECVGGADTLRESEKRFRRLVEHATDAFFILDFKGKIIDVNQHACESLGYSREELLALSIQNIEQDFVLETRAEQWEQMSPGVPVTVEGVHRRKDGTAFPVEVRVGIFESGEGDLILGLARDISDRKRAEDEKWKLETQLQYAQRMEAIGTLAGGIAHNFNNLLMGIQGNASIMNLDIDKDHPHHRILTNIEKQVQSGAKLTSQILGYAREGRYEVRPISLNHRVKETSNTFSVARKEIRLYYDLDENLPGIIADQGQIDQILLNLFVNAADAMPGGGDVYIKTMNITHDDMAGKPYKPKAGNYALLTVRDTGFGMDIKVMERIFEPFFTTKGFAKSTGLGLASCYGIIKAHGGYIDVESEKGKGSTFSIYLPATDEDWNEGKEVPGEALKGGGTVLLVDDEEIVLEAGELMLERLGYEVFSASSGREALDIYGKKQDRIDVVLLDMIMPDMGGGEAYDRMKEINPKVKVLLSSGYSIDGQATQILERGCNAFIQKPFNIETLSQNIREVLDNK